jgi:hypothetical protein
LFVGDWELFARTLLLLLLFFMLLDESAGSYRSAESGGTESRMFTVAEACMSRIVAPDVNKAPTISLWVISNS